MLLITSVTQTNHAVSFNLQPSIIVTHPMYTASIVVFITVVARIKSIV